MRQYEAVLQTLERLGGIATLGQLNSEVFKIKDCKWRSNTPFASIRRIVQQTDGIYKIKPGLWALESHRKELEAKGFIVETEENRDSEEARNFSHSYYQGLLLTVGNLRGKQTFAPNQDRNKLFVRKKIGELRTLQEIPPYSYDSFVQRSSTVDVIWFNERRMPDTFFEVEHSTDIQNSLLKFDDLKDFAARMIIVADERRHGEYLKKIQYSAFAELNKNSRVRFMSYADLEKQYNFEIERRSFRTVL